MSESALVKSSVESFFSEEQIKIIRDSYLGGASASEAAMLLEVAKARRLNPLMRQIHFVKREQWDRDTRTKKEVWSFQVSIDGLRVIAERTGRYDGQDEPEYEYKPDGTLKLCKVRVYKKGIDRAFVGVAFWDEYVQTFKDKQSGRQVTNSMWDKLKHVMLAKCAEALAIRKAFPEDAAGLYVAEEMGRDAEEKEATASVPRGGDAVRAALGQPPKEVVVEPPALPATTTAPVLDFSSLPMDELATRAIELEVWLQKNPRSKKAQEGQMKLAALQAEITKRERETEEPPMPLDPPPDYDTVTGEVTA